MGLRGGIVAILVGAAIIFFLFPRREQEQALLEQYATLDDSQA